MKLNSDKTLHAPLLTAQIPLDSWFIPQILCSDMIVGDLLTDGNLTKPTIPITGGYFNFPFYVVSTLFPSGSCVLVDGDTVTIIHPDYLTLPQPPDARGRHSFLLVLPFP